MWFVSSVVCIFQFEITKQKRASKSFQKLFEKIYVTVSFVPCFPLTLMFGFVYKSRVLELAR